jgi:hypothetical protein
MNVTEIGAQLNRLIKEAAFLSSKYITKYQLLIILIQPEHAA